MKAWQRLRQLTWLMALFAVAWFVIGWIDVSFDCKGMPASWPPGNKCGLLKFGYDWQSILAGLAAIVAALVGGYFIQGQVRLAEEQERERIRRKHAAARAMLPLALASLSEYADACARLLRNIHIQCSGSAVPPAALQNLRLPDLPASTTADLRLMVESSGFVEGEAIAEILRNIQVLASRLRSLQGPHALGHVEMLDNIEAYMINAAEIKAQADELFDYARGRTNDVRLGPPSVRALTGAFFSFRCYESRFDSVREAIVRRGS